MIRAPFVPFPVTSSQKPTPWCMHSNETAAAESPTGTKRDRKQAKALTQERSDSYLRKILVGGKKKINPRKKQIEEETFSH